MCPTSLHTNRLPPASSTRRRCGGWTTSWTRRARLASRLAALLRGAREGLTRRVLVARRGVKRGCDPPLVLLPCRRSSSSLYPYLPHCPLCSPSCPSSAPPIGPPPLMAGNSETALPSLFVLSCLTADPGLHLQLDSHRRHSRVPQVGRLHRAGRLLHRPGHQGHVQGGCWRRGGV